MTEINQVFSTLKSELKPQNMEKNSSSGIPKDDEKLKYQVVPEQYQPFFKNIDENILRYRLFSYMYNLLLNQKYLLKYKSLSGTSVDSQNSISTIAKNVQGTITGAFNLLNQTPTGEYSEFTIGKEIIIKETDPGMILEILKKNKPYDYVVENNENIFLAKKLLNIVEIILNNDLKVDSINNLLDKQDDLYKIIYNNMTNNSSSEFYVHQNNGVLSNYLVSSLLNESTYGFMTNFVYNVNIIEKYYVLLIQSLQNCLNAFKSKNIYELMNNLVDLNINYLILGSYYVDKSLETDYRKLIITYYFHVIIVEYLKKQNISLLRLLKELKDLKKVMSKKTNIDNMKILLDNINEIGEYFYTEMNKLFKSELSKIIKEKVNARKKPPKQGGQTVLVDIHNKNGVEKILTQQLVKTMDKNMNSEKYTNQKYQEYQNLKIFISSKDENTKLLYFYLLRYYYKTGVISKVFNNIMIYKNSLFLFDDYKTIIDADENKILLKKISINVAKPLEFELPENLKELSLAMDLKKFILNYYGKEKHEGFDFIKLIDLYNLFNNVVDVKDSTGPLTTYTLFHSGTITFKSELREQLTQNSSNNNSKSNTELLTKFISLINLVNGYLESGMVSINKSLYEGNEKIQENLDLFIQDPEVSNLFGFGFMIENTEQCDFLEKTVIPKLYEHIGMLNDAINGINESSNLYDFIEKYIQIMIHYIMIELYLLYGYIYWTQDSEKCKASMTKA